MWPDSEAKSTRPYFWEHDCTQQILYPRSSPEKTGRETDYKLDCHYTETHSHANSVVGTIQ